MYIATEVVALVMVGYFFILAVQFLSSEHIKNGLSPDYFELTVY